MNTDLRPSLWRTLRVLANPTRLRVLRTLQRCTPLTVSQIAKHHRLSMSHATQVLRALQARGLLRANRQGTWVFYAAEANASIGYAPQLARALEDALQAGENEIDGAIAALTAYTHERRIRIVRALVAGHATREALRATCHISSQALGRHLDKLARRGVIEERDSRLHFCQRQSPLQATLMGLACGQP